jgi:hypothetical protein
MLDRFDAYNFVTSLIPGAALLLALGASGFPTPDLKNVIPFIVVSFALGAISNRLGSLAIDPLIRRLRLLPKKDYDSYIRASEHDRKLDAIVQNANLYRTFATAGLVYFSLLLLRKVAVAVGISQSYFAQILLAVAILIFVAAYIGQDRYISKRVQAHRVDSAAKTPDL